MSAMDNGLNPQITLVPIGTQAATISLPGPKVERARKLKAVRYIDGASLATDDTNYLVIELKKGSTVLASLSTKTTTPGKLCNQALVALVATGDMLGGTPIDLAAGDQLSVVATKNGTGVPTSGLLELEWSVK